MDVTNAPAVQPPRENLVRGIRPGVELRDNTDGGKTLFGRFAVFNQWTEINSAWEGQFLEQIAPGAFKKTIRENQDGMRVLFQHGRDPQIGDKPLGSIGDLREQEDGAHYEVELFDTTYNRDLLPGLEAGVYGASFRFKVMREELVKRPEISDHNPEALPERTIKEAQVMEFGPVTWPAYEGATAGVRSLTDDYIVSSLFGDPERLGEFLRAHYAPGAEPIAAPSVSTPPPEGTSQPERREPMFKTREEYLAWISQD